MVDVPAKAGSAAGAGTPDAAGWPFEELLRGVSRTFAVSIPELPAPLDAWVGYAYLLCRIVDTIEDRPDTNEKHRQQMFDDLLAALGPPLGVERCRALMPPVSEALDDPCNRLMAGCDQVFAALATFPPMAVDAIRRCAAEMIEGLRRTPPPSEAGAARFVCATLAELEQYCHHAAGVVGIMLTRLFALHLGHDPHDIPEERVELAKRFGRGLQLTNIVKDHPSDLRDGRIFIPPEAARQCGLNPEILRQPALPLPVRAIITARAATHLDAALEYALGFPAEAAGVRLFCLQPLMMALLTLARVLTHVDTTPDDHPKITRQQVNDVLRTSRQIVADDRAIRDWYARHRRDVADLLETR